MIRLKRPIQKFMIIFCLWFLYLVAAQNLPFSWWFWFAVAIGAMSVAVVILP